MRYPLMPTGAFIGAVLVLTPVPSIWRTQSIAVMSMIAWLFVTNIIYGINALVWADNDVVHVPVWCDITTKLMIGRSVALPAAALCICMYLEMVASGRNIKCMNNFAEQQRRRIFETVLCVGVPLTFMALHCIVQDRRFDVVEAFGCQPAIYVSAPTILLVWIPPLLLSAIALIYAAVALHHFLRRRLSFAVYLQSANSSLTTHGYLRLMAMAVTQTVWGASFTILELSFDLASGLRPWTNWAEVHSEWQRVDRYTLDQLSPSSRREMFVLWWSVPAAALIFFAYFAFTGESRKDYKRAFCWVTRMAPRKRISGGAVLDLWPDAEGGTRRIVIHKHSTVEISKDGLSPPPYSPAATSFYTAEDVPSKAGMSEPPTPLAAREISQYSAESRRSSGTSFSMSILDDYPVSIPPSPPALARPSSEYNDMPATPVATSVHTRSFSSSKTSPAPPIPVDPKSRA